jgi:hypothetical protein
MHNIVKTKQGTPLSRQGHAIVKIRDKGTTWVNILFLVSECRAQCRSFQFDFWKKKVSIFNASGKMLFADVLYLYSKI